MERLLLILLLPCLLGFSGRLFIYGDEDVDGTEMTAEFAAAGFHTISTGATAGTLAFEWEANAGAEECGPVADGAGEYDMQVCSTEIGPQMARIDGACRSFAPAANLPLATASNAACGTTGDPVSADNDAACCAGTCAPTCIEDQLSHPGDACLIMLGANDAEKNEDDPNVGINDFPHKTLVPGLRQALNAADTAGLRCVVATSFPPRGDSNISFRLAQFSAMRDEFRGEVKDRFMHLFVDTQSLIDNYEAENGSAATDLLYADCPNCERPSAAGFEFLGKRLSNVLVSAVLHARVRPTLPNILMIIVDDLGDTADNYWSDLDTPNIDTLEARGTNFSRAYAPSPSCHPARTAAMSGLLPDTSGVYFTYAGDIRTDVKFTQAMYDAVLMPQYLRDHGYRTLGVGKLLHDNTQDDPYTRWDQYTIKFDEATIRDDEVPNGTVPASGLSGLVGTDPSGDGNDYPIQGDFAVFEHFEGPGFATDRTDEMPDFERTTKAIEWIDEVDTYDQPTFISVGYVAPHFPYYAPAVFHDLLPGTTESPGTVALGPRLDNDVADIVNPMSNDRIYLDLIAATASGSFTLFDNYENMFARSYMAAAMFIDSEVGKLIAATDASSEPWLIIFWGDHGFQIFEKDRVAKFTLWERGSRTRLFMVGNGIDPGVDIAVPSSLVDLFATIVDYAGIPVPDSWPMDGQSLRRFIDAPSSDNVVLMRINRTAAAPAEYTAYVSRDFKYIISDDDASTEFYLLDTDPNEQTNVTGDSQWDDEKALLVQGIAP